MSDPPKPSAPSVTIENLHAGQNLTIGSISVSDTAQIAREVRDARENIERLSARLAVSHAMVVTFLDLIGKANVPEGEENRTLIETATRLQLLEQKVRLLETADPQSQWIREAVEFALAQGDIKRAETLLAAAMNQIEGVVQLRNGNTAKALKLLARSLKVLAPLVKSNPKYAAVILQIGYTLKTQADALHSEDAKRSEMLLAEAEQRFRTVATDIPSSQKTVADLAGALNGLANIAYLRGDAGSAIEWGQVAVTLEPSYAFAWHDLLGAYMVLAQSGDVRGEKMLEVLSKLRATHAGFPGLDTAYLDSLEQSVRTLASADRT
jgi:tetratricopeptide (TPR) repeat protein